MYAWLSSRIGSRHSQHEDKIQELENTSESGNKDMAQFIVRFNGISLLYLPLGRIQVWSQQEVKEELLRLLGFLLHNDQEQLLKQMSVRTVF